MYKVFIGILIIYLNPLYVNSNNGIFTLLINILGTTLVAFGNKEKFSYKKEFKYFLILYILILITIFIQMTMELLDIEINNVAISLLRLLLIFTPLYLINITLNFTKEIDTYLNITNRLIITNDIIIVLLFLSIILNLFSIEVSFIFTIGISVLKIFFLINFYKLTIYY
ncbi:hypothetical protein [Miniphocaeibacter halophilus]|uniref:Uncharacterized protein n=1 Tax=Miniphocaeibacter halophilus TaxID=2931922 RepID=A0AC61MRW6_9FIRM|nr:hypothetical protein [Miniphocaeibacter halophilus]QQK07189.1 hypothetical protein JFY71_07605 [Miniphocaeibacter halophilus]